MGTVCNCLIYYPVSGILDFYFLYYTFRRIIQNTEGLEKFVALIRGYFDQKGMHMQFNVVDRQTLLDAQEHPEKYKHLVVRVAGYSALFTTLSRSLQDDIIRRTEQGF